MKRATLGGIGARLGIGIAAAAGLTAGAAESAAAIMFGNNTASFAFPGFAPQSNGAGVFANTLGLVDTASGYNLTGGSFRYTSAAADVGRTVVIDWLAHRDFTNNAGNYMNITRVVGSVVVPAGGSISRIDVTTDWAGINAGEQALVTLGPFAANANLNTTVNGAVFADAGPGDSLAQAGAIYIVPSAAGQVFVVNFPNSADSMVVPVPGSLALVGAGVVLMARRRR